jgi:hypothetical protein
MSKNSFSCNNVVNTGFKVLNQESIWNTLLEETNHLKKIHLKCFVFTLISIMISIFYIWMFTESYFFHYSISKILMCYISSQICHCTALYALVKHSTFPLRKRKKIIRLINDLKTNIKSDDFTAINETTKPELSNKMQEIEYFVEDLESNGRYPENDIWVTTISFEYGSIALTLCIMYFKYISFLKNAPTFFCFKMFFTYILLSACFIFYWSDKGFNSLKAKDRRSISKLRNVLNWININMQISSTGATVS